jgi:cell wall-associated NlpC family hydrolase
MRPRTPSNDDVIRVARSWLGTPYRHMGRERGAGVDCVQFVAAVGEESGACPALELPPYRMLNRPDKTLAMVERFAYRLPLGSPTLGAIVFFGRRPALPTHFGIASELYGEFAVIHADPTMGRVVEHTVPVDQLPLINSLWRFKEWQ